MKTGDVPTIDPVLLAVVRGRLEQIVEEMDAILVRSAFSPIVSEAQDRANGLYAFPSGATIAQGRTGLPIFIGSMQAAVGSVAAEIAHRTLKPGDVFAVNDPYRGGTHLQDVKLVEAVFHHGVPVLFAANTVHWIDVGGAAPGGFVPRATELIQEGLRFGPVRLVSGGVMNEDIRSVLLANVRAPEDVGGDLQAQLSALAVGRSRVSDLLEKYDWAEIAILVTAMEDASEREMRSYLAEVPDGSYEATEYLDDDGIGTEPLAIHLCVTIAGDSATFDFAGSSRPCRGPMNLARATTIAACSAALKHMFPTVPINAGCFRPVRFTIPTDTFLNAPATYPVSGYFETASRVADVVWQAFGHAMPEALFGNPFSTAGPTLLASGQDGDYNLTVLNFSGGYGATQIGDGLVGACPPLSMAPMAAVEVYEHRSPIIFERLAIREDSGGAGRTRGGCGTEYEIIFTRDEGRVAIMADQGRFGPQGLLGGEPGARTEVEIIRSSGETYRPEHLTKDQDVVVRKGDRIVLRTPGGGGFGPPLERPRAKVDRDLRAGYISSETAAQKYGLSDGREGRGPAAR